MSLCLHVDALGSASSVRWRRTGSDSPGLESIFACHRSIWIAWKAASSRPLCLLALVLATRPCLIPKRRRKTTDDDAEPSSLLDVSDRCKGELESCASICRPTLLAVRVLHSVDDLVAQLLLWLPKSAQTLDVWVQRRRQSVELDHSCLLAIFSITSLVIGLHGSPPYSLRVRLCFGPFSKLCLTVNSLILNNSK